ncbi:hypothetical protein [Pontiella sulfatireligans]|uniref:Uncharacterized protein n=1 Tax=Pontiella sulfatireligans TaxID=2750658 RepID=A0A6C2US87_9BACT|nr:hypothetical protein [Pontiella sulfatireligans]VGO22087.1 hypothetical protein SCARR_04168 [Pontiella sulfatireligans]
MKKRGSIILVYLLAGICGTTWFYHAHLQRQDDKSLTYSAGTKGNLPHDPS